LNLKMCESLSKSIVFTQYCYLSHILKFYVSDEVYLMNAMHVSRNWTDYLLSEHSRPFEKEVISSTGVKVFESIKSTKALFRALCYRSFHFVDRFLNNYPEMIFKRNLKKNGERHSLLFLSMNDTDMFKFLFEKAMEMDKNKISIMNIALAIHGYVRHPWSFVQEKLEIKEIMMNGYIFNCAVQYGLIEIILFLIEN
jgi:hypothetical protein